MDTAFSIKDGAKIRAGEFYRLATLHGDAWRAERKGELQCLACGGTAYFRTKSRDGKAPCFGSKDHAKTCTFLTSEPKRERPAAEEINVPRSTNYGENAVLHYRRKKRQTTEAAAGESVQDQDGALTRRHTLPEQGGPRSTRAVGLERFLANIVHAWGGVIPPGERMDVPERGNVVLSDYVRHFPDARESDIGRLMAYWGVAIDPTKTADGKVFLNPGLRSQNLMTVLLTSQVAQELMDDYRLADVDEFTGVYVLAIGRLKQGAKKLHVRIEDPLRIAILPEP